MVDNAPVYEQLLQENMSIKIGYREFSVAYLLTELKFHRECTLYHGTVHSGQLPGFWSVGGGGVKVKLQVLHLKLGIIAPQRISCCNLMKVYERNTRK